MERINSNRPSIQQYLCLAIVIVLSSFEFFFRAKNLLLLFYCLTFISFLYKIRSSFNFNQLKWSIFFATAVFAISMLQTLTDENRSSNNLIGTVIGCAGAISVAYHLNDKFIKVYNHIIIFISSYSLVIYCMCLFPEIYSILYGWCSNFPSLNVEDAVFSGGGTNFIIYNMQTDIILEMIGQSRNCGPFWEPGMFAFFINIALFFELFFLKHSHKLFTLIVLIGTLISTFSTGGYITGLFLFVFYVIANSKSFITWIIFLPLALFSAHYISELEFVGAKIEDQYNNSSYGSDKSRFGAFETQLDMIEHSPIIGGETLEKYATGRTLASGTLLPFVEYGIPVGLIFFALLYKSCRNISRYYNRKKLISLFLFSLIIILSFSQTILLTSTVSILLYSGLQIPYNKAYKRKNV